MAGPNRNGASVRSLQERLRYTFKKQELLDLALTHRSFAHENPATEGGDNERLEFLGDAVLNLILSRLLYEAYPDRTEGELSRLRAGLVNERQLKKLAETLELGDRLRLGKGEAQTGGRQKDSLLADALEAVLGAVYLEGGYPAAWRVIEGLYAPLLQAAPSGPISDQDCKTQLQEYCQGRSKTTPVYETVREEGPDHRKRFFVLVRLGSECIGRGQGRSKKEAEQAAARMALERLGEENGPDT
jgi:ribonuclease-3